MRWVLRVPKPVSLKDHLKWAGARVMILWAALFVAALTVQYGGLPITKFEMVVGR